MAKDKASVLLYRDIIHTVEKLDDKTAGLLFKHYLRYINDLEPKTDNQIVEIVFEPIKQDLKRDLKKYKKTCDKNRDNAFKRWDKKDATASDRIVSDAKDADKDKDIDIDKDIYKEFSFFRDDFKKVWIKEYLPLKTKKKASKTDRALKSGLNKIKTLSDNNYDLALKILEKSADSGWIDFYALKNTPIKKSEVECDDDHFIDPKGIIRLKTDFYGQTQIINEI